MPGPNREREVSLVHSVSLAYEDGSVFMSMAHGTRKKHKSDQTRSMDNIEALMPQRNNHGHNQDGLRL